MRTPMRAALVGLVAGGLVALLPWAAVRGRGGAEPPAMTLRLAFSTFMGGGPGGGTIRDIAFDSKGNSIVVGHGAGFTAPFFPSARRIGPGGEQNILVAKYAPDGRRLWVTIVGGSHRDRGYGVAVDAGGDIYVAGATSSPDFPVTAGAYSREFKGGFFTPVHGATDAYAFKLSADGQRLLYSTLLGGSNNDAARGGLAVDGQGCAYVVGHTQSPDFLAGAPGLVNRFLGGHSDAFILKLSPDGSRVVYARFLGGSENAANEMAAGVRVDAQGHAYVQAIVGSGDAETTPDAWQRTFGGGATDAYVAKLSPDGRRLLYATYLGGSADEFAEHQMALDAKGAVYVVGQTASPDFPVINAHQRRSGGSPDGYLVKLDPAGRPVFSTYVGGSGEETALGPAVDAGGNVFVVGMTSSPDFGVTAGALSAGLGRPRDAFLRVYGSEGQLLYSTLFGGTGKDFARYVAVDGRGNPIVAGETSSPDFPTSLNAVERRHNGGGDGFLVKFLVARPGRRP